MKSVFVLGSVNMDLVVSAARLPARGETVLGSALAQHPGGKGGNQAVACAKLGARTVFAGRVGDDSFGVELRGFLASQGVVTDELAVVSGAPTGTAVVFVETSGENAIIVVPGANALLSPSDVETLSLRAGDIALSQFEVPLAAVERFFDRARRASATTLLNPAPAVVCSASLLDAADVLVVNETELGFFLNESSAPGDARSALDSALRLRRRFEQIVVVTLGAQGAIAVQGSERYEAAGLRVDARDTTGAGDTFVGALAAGLCGGMSFRDAFERANHAAALSVQRYGAAASSPSRSELEAFLAVTGVVPN
jgi:ribokinase